MTEHFSSQYRNLSLSCESVADIIIFYPLVILPYPHCWWFPQLRNSPISRGSTFHYQRAHKESILRATQVLHRILELLENNRLSLILSFILPPFRSAWTSWAGHLVQNVKTPSTARAIRWPPDSPSAWSLSAKVTSFSSGSVLCKNLIQSLVTVS